MKLPRFETFYQLESYLVGRGLSTQFWIAYENELESEKNHLKNTQGSTKGAKERIEARILEWWNEPVLQKMKIADILYYRIGFCLIEAIKKRLREWDKKVKKNDK